MFLHLSKQQNIAVIAWSYKIHLGFGDDPAQRPPKPGLIGIWEQKITLSARLF